jgi:hypothetical protein
VFLEIHKLPNRSSFVNRDVLFAAMTRFNVPMGMVPGASEIRASPDFEQWTIRRIALFRRLCLTPMLAQRIRPQAWVLLFDKDVTPPIAGLLDELLEHDWIVPLLFGDDWGRRVARETREVFRDRFGTDRYQYVCCTRLDNDDSLNLAYHQAADAVISRVRKGWAPESSTCIDFPFGAIGYGDSLMIRLKEKSYFALVDPFDKFRTPYFCSHTTIDQYMPVVSVHTEQPMFIFQRHEDTVSGGHGHPVFEEFANPERVLGYFGLQPERPVEAPGEPRMAAASPGLIGTIKQYAAPVPQRFRAATRRLPLPTWSRREASTNGRDDARVASAAGSDERA